MLDPREDAQAYIEEHNINKLFQVQYWSTVDEADSYSHVEQDVLCGRHHVKQ